MLNYNMHTQIQSVICIKKMFEMPGFKICNKQTQTQIRFGTANSHNT